MFSCARHSPAGATGTKSSALAGKGHQLIFLAYTAVETCHAISKVSAIQIFSKFPLQVKRQICSIIFLIEKNLTIIFSNDFMKISIGWCSGNAKEICSFLKCRCHHQLIKLILYSYLNLKTGPSQKGWTVNNFPTV